MDGNCKAVGADWFDENTCTHYECINTGVGVDVAEIKYGMYIKESSINSGMLNSLDLYGASSYM